MRVRVVIAALAAALALGAAGAGASADRGAVTVRLPHQRLYAGEDVMLPVINTTGRLLYRSDCLRLARLTPRGWRLVTHSHGARVWCPINLALVDIEKPHYSDSTLQLVLYDDLPVGTYRITMYYRFISPHWKVLRPLTAHDPFVRLEFHVGPAPVRKHPRLPEQRILAIALSAATQAGDPHPTLIQHAAGPRFEANLVASGDEVPEWNWSYLIALRGHFVFENAPVPPGASEPSGSVITLVVDAATGEVTDSGVGGPYPHLARLGPVTTDLRSSD